MDVVHRLLEYWRQTDSKFRPGVSLSDLAQFEARYDVALPGPVREYFMAADGTGEEYDATFCRFYSLGEVKPVSDELTSSADRLGYPDCFVFAEWAAWCWGYAFRLTTDPEQLAPVFRVTGDTTPGPQIAPSFAQFLEQYLDLPGHPP